MAQPASTPAILALTTAKVPFEVHPYEVAEADERSYGEAVAAAIGVPAGRLFKTLVAEVDGSPVIAIVPVDGLLSTKALARAAGGKRAAMADPADAERLTGYVTGGISPFGRRRRLPVYADATVADFETVFVSAGRRGLQVEVAPADLVRLTGATVADLR